MRPLPLQCHKRGGCAVKIRRLKQPRHTHVCPRISLPTSTFLVHLCFYHTWTHINHVRPPARNRSRLASLTGATDIFTTLHTRVAGPAARATTASTTGRYRSHSQPHSAPTARPSRRKKTMTVPQVSASCAATILGPCIIATELYHPLVSPRASVSTTHGASGLDSAAGPCLVTIRNAGMNSRRAVESPTRRAGVRRTARWGNQPGAILPTTSARSKVAMSTTGYQSPSAALDTSSARNPGKMDRVTA
mmetsp:Transcript_29333/g.73199  ORF Transcript_29333/g.73199 Transcript_29333/m.73199 type:complete len:248 (-) Transcript_29333:165-908(-)